MLNDQDNRGRKHLNEKERRAISLTSQNVYFKKSRNNLVLKKTLWLCGMNVIGKQET
jgi:hypothetical protein